MNPEVQPTPRLAAWLSAASLGLLVEPVLPGAMWVTVAVDAALAALAWLDYLALRPAQRLEVRRVRDPVFSLGAGNPVTVEVRNPTATSFRVEVGDDPPGAFRADRDSFDAAMPAHSRWEGRYRLTPPKRGDYEFGPVDLRVRTRLGLLAVRRRVEGEDPTVRVYPNLRDVKSLGLLGMRDEWSRLGIRAVRRPEAGREFESLRDYLPGDEPRTVDWKATAHRNRLTVRQYDVEHSQVVLLVLDLGRTMASRLGDLTKADLAVNACVLMAAAASRLDDRVGVLAFADTVLGYHPPLRGRNQASRLMEFLYPLEARPVESDYRAGFLEIARRLRRRAMIVLFTDLVDPESSSQLIKQLGVLATHHSVLCVALSDYELEELLRQQPQDADGLYRQAVARALLEDRDGAAARLTERGVRVLKASPEHLSVQVVNRYLEWKRRG